MIQKGDSLPDAISRVDTIYFERINPLFQEKYIEFLEKSNDQLSMVGNPLAWFIGALGVLFAAGAIISGFLLFNQSRKTKEQFKELFEGSENRILGLEEKLNETRKSLIDSLRKETEEAIAKINASGSDTNAELKSKLQHTLKELEDKSNQINIKGYEIQTAKEYISSSPPMMKECSSCGLNYTYRTSLKSPFQSQLSNLLSPVTREVTCPKCGHTELV